MDDNIYQNNSIITVINSLYGIGYEINIKYNNINYSYCQIKTISTESI